MSAVTSMLQVADATAIPARPWWWRRAQILVRGLRTKWRPVAVVLRPDPAQRASASLVPEHAAALAEWAHWCEQHAGSQCVLGLSGHWLLSVVGPPGGAGPQWEHYLGLSASAFSGQWVSRSFRVSGAELTCAAPQVLIAELQAVARRHHVKLRQVGPWWGQGLQRWMEAEADGDLLSAFEPGLLTHFHRQQGLDAKPRLDQCWTEVSESDALPLAGPTMLVAPIGAASWLSTAVLPSSSAQRTPPRHAVAEALDFVGPRVRTALVSWAVLVLGLAACMAVGDRARQVDTELDETLATVKRLERALHQQTLARTPPRAEQAASGPAMERTALKPAARVAQMLAFPWPDVIDRVEQAAAGENIVLTGFSLDVSKAGSQPGARPQARLQAAVLDDASALRWLDLQGGGAQWLSRQPLNTPFETAQGRYAWRVEAVWSVDLPALRSQP